jgi:hypothetical protein
VKLWDASNGGCLATWEGHTEPVRRRSVLGAPHFGIIFYFCEEFAAWLCSSEAVTSGFGRVSGGTSRCIWGTEKDAALFLQTQLHRSIASPFFPRAAASSPGRVTIRSGSGPEMSEYGC